MAISSEQILVIDSRFCFPHPIKLSLKRKTLSTTFLDVNGNIAFQEKGFFFGTRRVLSDATRNPLVSVKPKTFSFHSRWRAFRGDSSDFEHLLFSVRNSSAFSTSKVQVFLATNTEEKKIDFKIKRSFSRGSCTIFKGESDIVIDEMSKKKTSNNILRRKTRMVTVYPGVDSAFIVALIVTLVEQEASSSSSSAVAC